jgi:hypothetical protein
MSLPRLLCTAEADEGLTACFGGGKAGADSILGVESDMAFEFGGEVGIGMTCGEEATDT